MQTAHIEISTDEPTSDSPILRETLTGDDFDETDSKFKVDKPKKFENKCTYCGKSFKKASDLVRNDDGPFCPSFDAVIFRLDTFVRIPARNLSPVTSAIRVFRSSRLFNPTRGRIAIRGTKILFVQSVIAILAADLL